MIYKIKRKDGKALEIHNPVDMPDVMQVLEIEERLEEIGTQLAWVRDYL